MRQAREAFESPAWRSLPASERGLLLFRLADAIQEDAERIGSLETRDNGKLYREMLIQLQLVPKWIRYFAGMADKVEGATIPLDRLSVLNYTVPEPLGVVAIITPWNSPVFLTMMAAAPALAAGNTVVVKPSEVTSASMLAVAELAAGVGFPPGVFNVITGLGDTGKALVEHPLVDKISLTGGVEAGRAVGQAAAQRFTPVTLELGGKSANIVFEDANLDAAESGVLAGIFAAAGQTCVAGSRAFVHESVYDELAERLIARAGDIRIGNPMDPETQMGPIATKAQLEKVAELRRARARRGRRDRGRRAAGRGAGARGRLLLAADDRRERRARLLPRAERGLRAGARAVPVQLRGRGAEGGQQHPLRARRRPVDPRRQPRAPRRRAAGRGHGVGEHVPGDGAAVAVRRVQGERHRATERHRRDPRVRPDEEHLGRALRRGPGPVRAASARRS